jgi:hypothetical protein
VLFVTDMANPTGAGTFHQALEDAHPDSATYIIFRAGGVVYHNSGASFPYDITSAHNCLYIAGQSAPDGPIYIADTIPDSEQYFNINGVQDLIIRHLGIRVDTAANSNCCTPLRVLAGQRLMFDHLSVTYGDDQLWTMQPTGTDSITDVTMQHSVVGAAAKSNILQLGFHDDPPVRRVSFYKSFTAHSRLRNPRMDINDDTVGESTTMASQAEWVNVLVYDVASRFGWLQSSINFDLIGSVYRDAPGEGPNYIWWEEYQPGGSIGGGCPRAGQPQNNVPSIYAADDTILNAGSNYDLFRARCSNTAIPDSIKRGTPFGTQPYFDITPWIATGASAVAVDDSVLADIGPNRVLGCDGTFTSVEDPVDSLLVWNYENGVALSGNKPADFVGWPVPSAGSACADQDNDGLPDEYEKRVRGANDSTSLKPDSATASKYWVIDLYLDGKLPGWNPAGGGNPPPQITYGDGRIIYLMTIVTDADGNQTLNPDSLAWLSGWRVVPKSGGTQALVATCDTINAWSAMDSAVVDDTLSDWSLDLSPPLRTVPVPGC